MVLGDTGPRTANTWVSTWTGEQLVETTQALDKPRHHTAKDGVYGARGARLTHSQTATPGNEHSSSQKPEWNVNRWMILEKKLEERTYSW